MSALAPRVRRVGPEAAEDLYAVVRAAFAGRPPLDPPADALAETPDSLREALGRGGGLIATLGDEVVGGLVLDTSEPGTVFLRRVGVRPDAQRHGVAAALVDAALWAGAGAERIAVLAREELPATQAFWRHQGFVEVGASAPYVELARPSGVVHEVPDADTMRGLGEQLAGTLVAGDVVVLIGGLGAGKTSLTQGLGAGLEVRGDITSPTFVISRVHPSLVGGPALVHVDAYRLGGVEELDDLDLDTSLDEAVTIVEWGHGLAEGLAGSRLEIRIDRAEGATADPLDDDAPDPRRVLVTGVGPRWER